MSQQENISSIIKLITEGIVKINEATSQSLQAIKEFVDDIPTIDLSKYNFSNFKFDYSEIEKVTQNNSLSGWTMTSEMELNFYLDSDLLKLNQSELDQYFLTFFETNDNKHYLSEKAYILENIRPNWKGVMDDCFQLYENDKYKVIIPLLITIVESEVSDFSNSTNISHGLLRDMKTTIMQIDDDYLIIIAASLNSYLSKRLYGNYKSTLTGINRNRVLHGSDDPQRWTKVDALKLINVISSMLFIKEQSHIEKDM